MTRQFHYIVVATVDDDGTVTDWQLDDNGSHVLPGLYYDTDTEEWSERVPQEWEAADMTAFVRLSAVLADASGRPV